MAKLSGTCEDGCSGAKRYHWSKVQVDLGYWLFSFRHGTCKEEVRAKDAALHQ